MNLARVLVALFAAATFSITFSATVLADDVLDPNAQKELANELIEIAEREVELARSQFARAKAMLILEIRQLDLQVLDGNAEAVGGMASAVDRYNHLILEAKRSLQRRGYANRVEVLQAEYMYINRVFPRLYIPIVSLGLVRENSNITFQ